MDQVKRWRFYVESLDGDVAYIDANGGPDGDVPDAEFIGTSREALAEGDRRCDLWERNTGWMVATITRESHGAPNYSSTQK